MSLKKEKNRWSDSDEAKLLKLISDNIPMEKITKKIKKEEKVIKHKLKKIALRMCSEKKTKDEINKSLKFLSDEQITKIINHVNKKNLKNSDNSDTKDSEDLSDFGIKKSKMTSSKKTPDNLTSPNKIISMLTEINTKLDFIIANTNKNNNFSTKVNFKAQNNTSTLNDTSSVEKNKIRDNTKTTNRKNKETVKETVKENTKNKSELSDSSSGEDTDDIINMINKNRGGR